MHLSRLQGTTINHLGGGHGKDFHCFIFSLREPLVSICSHLIDFAALANQGDNAIGSICPSVCLWICLPELAYHSNDFLCVSVSGGAYADNIMDTDLQEVCSYLSDYTHLLSHSKLSSNSVHFRAVGCGLVKMILSMFTDSHHSYLSPQSLTLLSDICWNKCWKLAPDFMASI